MPSPRIVVDSDPLLLPPRSLDCRNGHRVICFFPWTDQRLLLRFEQSAHPSNGKEHFDIDVWHQLRGLLCAVHRRICLEAQQQQPSYTYLFHVRVTIRSLCIDSVGPVFELQAELGGFRVEEGEDVLLLRNSGQRR